MTGIPADIETSIFTVKTNLCYSLYKVRVATYLF